MAVRVNPTSFRFPFELKDQPPDVVQAHRYSFQGILDLNNAVVALKSQISAIQTPTTGISSASAATNTITTVIDSILSGLGTVNDQTGQVTYTTQTTDSGALLILNDASPVAVSLNSVVATPFALFITNAGIGTATLTPTSGTVNGGASLVLLQNQVAWIVFDGTNWETNAIFAPPLNKPAVTHQFLTAYASATGVFSQAQPAYSDISGTPTLPATFAPVAGEYLTGYNTGTGAFSTNATVGISATIVTAALTTLGTQGSMTFVDGILTAQTPAT